MIKKTWFIVNAKNKTLGKLSKFISNILNRKHKTNYIQNKIIGDVIIIINVNYIKFTGSKYKQKLYYRHSGYPGGLKISYLKDLYKIYPEKILKNSIKGMLPKKKLMHNSLKNLKIFKNTFHEHESQKPKILNI